MVETGLRIGGVLVVAYLIGAIPFAVIVSRVFFHIDVRDHGSGNAGATNVMRVLGVGAGIAVLLLDALKGVAAVLIARTAYPATLGENGHDWMLIGAAFAVVLGHSYSPYLKFQGGKGVATAAGALLVLTPVAWPILFATFAVVVAVWRMVSLGSIVIALQFPLLMLVFYADRPAFLAFSVVASALVVWRHRSNIVRIAHGEEAKMSVGRIRRSDREEDAE